MISKNFIKSSFIYTLAGALPMASAIILLPFYIHFLPTEVYGALALYLAFALLIQVLVVYSFDSSLYIHFHEFKNDKSKLASFVSSAFIFMLLSGVGVGLVSVVFGDWVFHLVFQDQKISFFPYGVMAVGIGIVQSLFKVYCNLMQSREKPVSFLWANLILFALIASLTIGGLYIFPSTLIGPVGGRMVAGLVAAIWVLYQIYKEFGLHFNFTLLKSTFGYNHYTFLYQIQLWVVSYLDRFIMVFFLPLSAIGIYDFALKCLIAIDFIMSGLHSSFYPKVVSGITAQSNKGSVPELNRYYHGLSAVVMILVSVGILVLPFLVDLLNSERGYQEAIQYFPYIAVIYILRSMRFYFAVPYAVLKYTKPLPVIYFFIVLIKIGLMLALINPYGIYGVVVSALISTVFEILLLRFVLRSKFNFQFNAFKIIGAPIILLLTIVVLEAFWSEGFPIQLHLGYVVLTGGLLLWVYRNELKLFTKIFSTKEL